MASKNSRFRSIVCLLLAAGLALPTLSCASASEPAAAASTGATWVFPVIKNFGPAHPRPDAAAQPDPAADYKVIVDVSSGEKDHTKPLQSLDRLARLVNLLGVSNVPPEHVHIVAVLEGEAGYAAASNTMYRKQFKVDNPNLAILHALKQSGVELLVCSQAMAHMGMKDDAIGPDITVSFSALTDFVVYGQRGYTYLPL